MVEEKFLIGILKNKKLMEELYNMWKKLANWLKKRKKARYRSETEQDLRISCRLGTDRLKLKI